MFAFSYSKLVGLDNSKIKLYCLEDESCSNNTVYGNDTNSNSLNSIIMILDSSTNNDNVGSAYSTTVFCDDTNDRSVYACNVTCLAPNAGANLYVKTFLVVFVLFLLLCQNNNVSIIEKQLIIGHFGQKMDLEI